MDYDDRSYWGSFQFTFFVAVLAKNFKMVANFVLFQHQGTDHPSLAQQSGLSTQSCQKTSTNDTNLKVGRNRNCQVA